MEGASSSAHALPPRVSDESSGEKTDGDQANKGRGSKKGVMKKPASRAVKGHDDDTTDHEHQPLGGKKNHDDDDDHADDPSGSDSGIPPDLKPKGGIKRPAAAKSTSRKKPASAKKEKKARGRLEHMLLKIIGCNHRQI